MTYKIILIMRSTESYEIDQDTGEVLSDNRDIDTCPMYQVIEIDEDGCEDYLDIFDELSEAKEYIKTL